MSEASEGIRETASTLLTIANRLDGIDVSVDAMCSGAQERAERSVLVTASTELLAELDEWSAPVQVKIVPDAGPLGWTLIARAPEAYIIDGKPHHPRDVTLRFVDVTPEQEREQLERHRRVERHGVGYLPSGFGWMKAPDDTGQLACLRSRCGWSRVVVGGGALPALAERLAREHLEKEHDGA